MRIGVIIPDRGDRPLLMENCLKMFSKNQITCFKLKHEVLWFSANANEIPASDEVDIVPRIRLGYQELTDNWKVDIIAIIENDDFYSTEYLAYMVDQWEKHGRPDLFGTSYTIYYHMKFKAYYKFHHSQRASLMNTLIKPGLDFQWPVDREPFLDIHLWNNIINRVIFTPDKHYSIGMKHGIGKCGGGMHEDDHMNRLRYPNHDHNGEFLKDHLDPESFNFYFNYFK